MREYQMQLSGPWPPYHFVHRLTLGVHASPPQPAADAVPVPMLAATPVIRIPQPVTALA
jgi:hypothetical protein